MASTGEAGRLRRRSALIVVALLPGLLVLAATQGHPGLSYDSVVYASTRRVLETTGAWSFSTLWPAGLAFVVALVGPGWGAMLLNATALVGNLFVSYGIGRRLGLPPGWAVALVALVGFSLATTSTYVMLWSEPLFVLACNAAVLALLAMWSSGRLWSGWAVVLVLAVNVASLMRFASVPLIVTSVLMLAVVGRRNGLRGLGGGLALGAATGATFVASVAWNLLRGAPATGPRYPSRFTVTQVLDQLLASVGAFVVNRAGLPMLELVGVAVALVAVVGLIKARRGTLGVLTPVVAWLALYVVFIVAAVASTWIDPLGYRLLLPVHTATVALGLIGVRSFAAGRVWLAPVAVLYAGFLAVSTCMWLQEQDGFGYSDDVARWAVVANDIQAHIPAGAPIVSDDPAGLAWVTGRDEIRGFPDAGPAPAGPYYAHDNRFEGTRAGDYVVILEEGDEPAFQPPSQLIARGDGFAIFRAR